PTKPTGAGGEDKPAGPARMGGDVVDRAGHVGMKIRVAVRVAVDERAELNPRGLLGDCAKRRPGLKVRTIRVSGEGKEMVPVEDDVDAEVFELTDRVADGRVRRMLVGDLHADPDRALSWTRHP